MLYFKEIPPINTKVYTEDQLKSQLTSSLRTISAFLNLAFQSFNSASNHLKYIIFMSGAEKVSENFDNKMAESSENIKTLLSATNTDFRVIIGQKVEDLIQDNSFSILDKGYGNLKVMENSIIKLQKDFNRYINKFKIDTEDETYKVEVEKYQISMKSSIETITAIKNELNKALNSLILIRENTNSNNICVAQYFLNWQLEATPEMFNKFLALVDDDWPRNKQMKESVIRYLNNNISSWNTILKYRLQMKPSVLITKLHRYELWFVSDYLVENYKFTGIEDLLKTRVSAKALETLDKIPDSLNIVIQGLNNVIGSERLAEIVLMTGYRPEEIIPELHLPISEYNFNKVNYNFIKIEKDKRLNQTKLDENIKSFLKYLNGSKNKGYIVQPLSAAIVNTLGVRSLNRVISDPIFRENVDINNIASTCIIESPITFREMFLTRPDFSEKIPAKEFFNALVHQYGKLGAYLCMVEIKNETNNALTN